MNDLLYLSFFYKTTELNNSLAFVNIIFQNFLLFIVVYFVVLFPNSTCGIFWVYEISESDKKWGNICAATLVLHNNNKKRVIK